jgi:hypothetical protein
MNETGLIVSVGTLATWRAFHESLPVLKLAAEKTQFQETNFKTAGYLKRVSHVNGSERMGITEPKINASSITP